jgi:glycosyltransferase involved in cell wall biosynthesis
MMLEEALEQVWRARPDAFFLTAGPRFWRDGGPIARALAEGRAMDRGRVPFSEIPAVLGASDALVMPMRDTRFNWSRWPHKFGDYLAAGRPVAITRIGDCARDVEEHRLGAVGAPTAEGLAAALLEVLARREDWSEMGSRARRLAESSHSWPARFEGLARFLRGRGIPV